MPDMVSEEAVNANKGDDQDPAIYVEGSQPSGTGLPERTMKRKRSFVEKPICQSNALLASSAQHTPFKQARHCSRLRQMGV